MAKRKMCPEGETPAPSILVFDLEVSVSPASGLFRGPGVVVLVAGARGAEK